MKRIVNYIRALIASIWLLFAKDNKEKEVEKPVAKSQWKPMRLDLQYFSEDPKDPPADPQDPPGDDKKFNQEDVNKIVQDRVSRAEKKAQKALAKQLGYDSVEEMTAALNKDKRDKDKDKEKEKDPVDVDALLESKLKEEREKTFIRLRNSEVKVQAKELGFADWEDALALADLSDVKEDDKGNITGVKEALEKLAEKKPHLLEKQGSHGGFGANVPNNQQRKKESLENIKKMASTRGTQQTQAHNPWA